MWKRIANFFNAAVRKLRTFLNALLEGGLELALAGIQEIANQVVTELNYENLTNDEKRKEAIKRISERALAQGNSVKESLIRLAIELAVAALKQGLNK